MDAVRDSAGGEGILSHKMSRQDWCQPGIWERMDISELWKIFCIYRLANGDWVFFLTDPFTRQMKGSFVCMFSLFFPGALLRYNSQITLCKFKVYDRIIDTCIHCEMITTVNLTHPSGSHHCHFVIVMARTFKTYSWSNFQVYDTILLVLIACWMLDFHDFNWKFVLFD